jgi:addiction module HigA family antidote
MINNKNTYNPDHVVHPGQIIEEILVALEMKKSDLANRTGLSLKTISQIIHEKEHITPETALKLERVLGIAAYIWRNLDSNYRIFITKQKDQEKYAAAKIWIKEFPIKELIKRNLIKQVDNINDLIEQLLAFFSVGSLDSFKKQIEGVSFRKSRSFQSKTENILTWLRIGYIEAQKIDAPQYNRELFVSTLKEIRSVTTHKSTKEMLIKTKELCLRSGVVVLYVEEIEKTYVSGAAFWLSKDKPVVMLSSRYKRDDQFWFSFYHDCGHILNDSKKDMFLDYDETDKEEDEANTYARNILIPQKEYNDFISCHKEEDINAIIVSTFAKKIGIAPGIVVGRLQHEKVIGYSKQYSNLMKKIDFSDLDK